MERRTFLKSSFYSSLLFGAGGVIQPANAVVQPLNNRVLVNLNLEGGADLRHLIVPEMPSNLTASTRNTQFYRYWLHRHQSQNVADNEAAWQARWNDEYHHITINDGSVNQGRTFGIWKGAGWLITMFEEGKVALVANSAVGRNRAHDRSQVQLRQGNVTSIQTDTQRSGWGGRVARATNQNSISITNRPNAFCFGPVDTPVYDQNQIDNRSYLSIQDTRNIGLRVADLNNDQTFRTDDKFARSLRTYYQSLQGEFNQGALDLAYEKALSHEQNVRFFGEQLRMVLDFETPDLIRALYRGVDGINVGNNGNPRRVLRSGNFGQQIRNLHDTLAANQSLQAKVVGMEYGGWDSHAAQADRSNNNDIYDPNVNNRGIEQGFRDIFGGPSVASQGDLHGGFSALYQSIDTATANNIVLTVASEFGRQIRQNSNDQAGTDHGDGNIIMVIGNEVNGGVYGDLFPESEIDRYDEDERRTPDIESLTEMEHIFGTVTNWVTTNPTGGGGSNAASQVFPRLNLSISDDNYPDLEENVSFSSLFNT